MFLTNIIWMIAEWKRFKWYAIIAFVCEGAATYVGQQLIIPINKTIGAGLESQAQLNDYMLEWIKLNDVRWVIMTIMWLTMMVYFNHKAMAGKV